MLRTHITVPVRGYAANTREYARIRENTREYAANTREYAANTRIRRIRREYARIRGEYAANKGGGLVMRYGFWWTTSCSHASSNAIKTTDRVVAELIADVKTCSDF